MSSHKERMQTGELYLPGDPEIVAEQTKRLDMLYDFNQTRPTEMEKRQALMKKMFAEIGEGCYIEPPFHANFGGGHIHFGDHIYCNFNFTCVDDTDIYVGSHTLFGPNVILATAGHPILPELRNKEYQFNMPIHIGESCWIGAGVVVLPGVHIGSNTVIGAGSVVTKDIPDNVIAVGNPCRVLRPVGEKDKDYYFKDRKIDWDVIKKDLTEEMEEKKFKVYYGQEVTEHVPGEKVILDVTMHVTMMGVHNRVFLDDPEIKITRNYDQIPSTISFIMPAKDVHVRIVSEPAGRPAGLPLTQGMQMFPQTQQGPGTVSIQQPYTRSSTTWKCRYCGEDRNEGKFCTNCGGAREEAKEHSS